MSDRLSQLQDTVNLVSFSRFHTTTTTIQICMCRMMGGMNLTRLTNRFLAASGALLQQHWHHTANGQAKQISRLRTHRRTHTDREWRRRLCPAICQFDFTVNSMVLRELCVRWRRNCCSAEECSSQFLLLFIGPQIKCAQFLVILSTPKVRQRHRHTHRIAAERRELAGDSGAEFSALRSRESGRGQTFGRGEIGHFQMQCSNSCAYRIQ